jgi:predicted nucleic acid-binding protein
LITAVDTNVLLDIFVADAKFGPGSKAALKRCLEEGALLACDVVWIETATAFPEERTFLAGMQTLDVGFSPINQETALLAAKAWRKYRNEGGKRQRVAADFLIGAHALAQCDCLLTRDRGFYKEYFGKIRIVDPSA